MDAPELRNRTAAFARDVARYTRPLLADRAFRNAAQQLAKSSSSVAANCRAVTCGRSRPEFRSKVCVTLEEADESVYWLEHLLATGVDNPDRARELLREARELAAIYGAARRTLDQERRAAQEANSGAD